MSCAIGLSELDQAGGHLLVGAAADHDQPDLPEHLEVGAVALVAVVAALPGVSQSMTPSLRATKPSSDTDMSRISRRRSCRHPVAQVGDARARR